MRSFISVFILLLLVGCATPRGVAPREYLDEATAATVTVVADPWVYSERRAGPASAPADYRPVPVGTLRGELVPENRDFLSVYAIDVNRMGTHHQYLAVLQSLPRSGSSGAEGSVPTLELRTPAQTLSLQPITVTPRELGIAQAPAQAGMRGSRWWYFPVGKDVLIALGGSSDLQASLLVDGERIAYDVWRDGSAALAELTAALP